MKSITRLGRDDGMTPRMQRIETYEQASKAVLTIRDIEEPAILVEMVKEIIRVVGGEIFVFQ